MNSLDIVTNFNFCEVLLINTRIVKCYSWLNNNQIPVLVDLPVGKNMMDHQGTALSYTLNSSIPLFGRSLGQPENINAYIYNRTGPLTATADVQGTAFLKAGTIQPSVDFPNYQLYFLEGESTIFRDIYKFVPQIYDAYYKPNENVTMLHCLSQVVQPRSIGSVTLNSDDPYDEPVIDPNYFDHPQDLEDVVDGLKTCQKIAKSEPMKSIGAKEFAQVFPGCQDYKNNEDKYLKCIVSFAVLTTSHQAGTAKMGDPTDPTTVVDPTLKVKGVKGLRVVDASIMPKVTSGNTMTPVYMIAEKAADLIKQDLYAEYYPDVYTVVFNDMQ